MKNKLLSRLPRTAGRAVAALALLTLAFVGCGNKEMAPYGPGGAWVEDMRSRITEDITDTDKATRLLEQIDQIEAVLTDLDHELLGYYNRMAALDEDYHSTREDWQMEIESFNSYRSKTLDKLIDITLEMKRIAGRDDWEVVSDMDDTLYESWQRSLGS